MREGVAGCAGAPDSSAIEPTTKLTQNIKRVLVLRRRNSCVSSVPKVRAFGKARNSRESGKCIRRRERSTTGTLSFHPRRYHSIQDIGSVKLSAFPVFYGKKL